MIACNLIDQKDFMNKLLLGDVFDAFWLVEASITTYNTFRIDGFLQKNFFETPVLEALERTGRTYSLWSETKSFCYSIIKGRHTPLHFRIVFQLSKKNTEAVIRDAGVAFSPEEVEGLYLNLQYQNKKLTCTTGSSMKIFTMDKSLDQVWDQMVLSFFKKHAIPFEQI